MKRMLPRLCLLRRIPWLIGAALAVCLGWSGGCTSVNMNPSYFPYFFPTPYSNYDPDLSRVELRPNEEATNTICVGTQHVLLTTVYDKNNTPRRGRQVEFMISGAGSIIDVAPTCHFWRNKPDQQYAISNTVCFEHNLSPTIAIRPGQTWCVLTSAVEGDTHVSVFVPGIHDWEKRLVHTTIRWVDAGWEFPIPAQVRAGTAHVLTTKLLRHTDKKPLANYRVRYKIAEGPGSVFIPSKTQEYTAVSGLDGLAQVAIMENVPILGTTKVMMEVIRPPDPSSPGGSGVTIARGETTVEWLAAAAGLKHTGPALALVNSEVTYETVVTNTGKVDSLFMNVDSAIPDGLQFLRSDPPQPAIIEGQTLHWQIGKLAPGQAARPIRTTYKTLRQGPILHCVDVTSEEGTKVQACAKTEVTSAGLKVGVTGPATASLGQPIVFNVTVANPGGGPLDNILLTANFTNGLEHESRAKYQTFTLPLSALAPQSNKTESLVLIARQPGPQTVKITASAGSLSDQAQATVTVQQPQVSLTMEGQPLMKYVGRPTEWRLTVSNPGGAVLNNVVVRDRLPAELGFSNADSGGEFKNGEVVWTLPSLQPGEKRVLQLTTIGKEAGRGVVHAATASADPDLRTTAQVTLDVINTPSAIQVEISDFKDPLPVGQTATYRIKVTNTGQMPLNQVEIQAVVPPELQIVAAKGPPGSKEPETRGQTIIFARVDVEKDRSLEYVVEAKALRPGDTRFRVELRSQGREPVLQEQRTLIYDAGIVAPPPMK
jgi:uncharacterized repeat protein (TIGR01451 family)